MAEGTSTSTRWVVLAAVVLVAYAVAIGVWASTPSTDHVPVGTIDGAKVSQPVECNAVIDAEPRDDTPLPDPNETFAEELAVALAPTELDYSREPCESPQRDGRLVLAINVLVIVALVLAWTGWVLYRRRTATAAANDRSVTTSAT